MSIKQRLRYVAVCGVIALQLLTPLIPVISVLSVAARADDTQDTLWGLDSLISEQGRTAPEAHFYFQSQDEKAGSATKKQTAGLPELSVSAPDNSDKNKPELNNSTGTESRIASGASQAGSLLAGEDSTDAAINYSQSLGEGLINQQINDWLNQLGHASVSVGTREKLAGDLLLPMYETDDSVFFSQFGARTNQDRNTVNLGLGYRHYQGDWMAGINSFYDYDYTGKNKRFGAGVEAWTDNLKLAANGYIRQTDWHQSVLSRMEDYDERPASGFDLRASAYLPSWPSIGGNLKYEQYFGKGVSVSGNATPDSLKDNPVIVTAGIDYTPFPLMTLSTSHSVGDSSDVNVGVEFSYRFGMPWSQQISPDAVELMRSLAGSRYDFVDRNYDIVMQYRKQDLLHIRLPERMTVQASETINVALTVDKAKYGLKEVDWHIDPQLTAHGGHYQILSATELEVKLPAYVFSRASSQDYKISAIATDNKNNPSNTAETIISVIPSDKVISNLTISPDDRILPVHETNGYVVTGLVVDGKGTPQAGQLVTFSVDGFVGTDGHSGATIGSKSGKQKTDNDKITITTQSDGKAEALLVSTVAGEGTITASMDNGNNSGSARVSFVADNTTAWVANIVTVGNNALANGAAENSVQVIIQDKYSNIIEGADVYFTASNDAVVTDKAITNAEGVAKATLTSTTAGPVVVTASFNDSSKDVTVNFGVGQPTAGTSGITLNTGSYSSGDDIEVTVSLKDKNQNPVSGLVTLLTENAVIVPNAALKSGSNWSDNSDGTYHATYTAQIVGSGLKATLKLNTWNMMLSSTPYDIRVSSAVQANSAIGLNADRYGSSDDITVTVTLKDLWQNPILRQSGLLVNAVKVPNAMLKSGSSWSDNNDGTYRATYTALDVGSGLEASLQLTGWDSARISGVYSITYGTTAPRYIYANNHMFDTSSEEGTFPTTGFIGATFSIMPEGAAPADYIWTSDVSWVSVSDTGIVTFTGTGTKNKVTITAVPKNSIGKSVVYSFTVKNWYIGTGSMSDAWGDWDAADKYCKSQSGYRLSTASQLVNNINYIPSDTRSTGALWNEWGDVTHYPDASVPPVSWTLDIGPGSSTHYVTALGGGYLLIENIPDYMLANGICHRAL
jgi:Bacterial Ig-like domain (group 1)./Protein of unknown function (DUF3442).